MKAQSDQPKDGITKREEIHIKRLLRSLALFLALGMTVFAFELHHEHPTQAGLIMWGFVFPVILLREYM